jgi:hypothetical protein
MKNLPHHKDLFELVTSLLKGWIQMGERCLTWVVWSDWLHTPCGLIPCALPTPAPIFSFQNPNYIPP